MSNATKRNDERPLSNGTGSKPYVRPALKTYGTAAMLTKAIGMTSTVSDGGAMVNMSKTH